VRADGRGLFPDGVRHLGGLHGAGKDVVKAISARCTASLLIGARSAAVGALREGFHSLPPAGLLCTPILCTGSDRRTLNSARLVFQGFSVQLSRSVARQLEALMMVATEMPKW